MTVDEWMIAFVVYIHIYVVLTVEYIVGIMPWGGGGGK